MAWFQIHTLSLGEFQRKALTAFPPGESNIPCLGSAAPAEPPGEPPASAFLGPLRGPELLAMRFNESGLENPFWKHKMLHSKSISSQNI